MTAAERDRLLIEINLSNKDQDKKLDEIHTEVKLTNGRVTKLEHWQSRTLGSVRTWYVVFGAIGTLIGIAATLAAVVL